MSIGQSGILHSSDQGILTLVAKGILFVSKNDVVNAEGGLEFVDGLDGSIIIRSAVVHVSPTEILEFLPIHMLVGHNDTPPNIRRTLNDLIDQQLRAADESGEPGESGPQGRVVKLRNALDASDYDEGGVERTSNDDGVMGHHPKTSRELELLANYVRHNDTCICPATFARYSVDIQRIFDGEDRCDCSASASIDEVPPMIARSGPTERKLLRDVVRADDQGNDSDGDGLLDV